VLRGIAVGHGVAKNPCGGGAHFQIVKPYGTEASGNRQDTEWNLTEIEREQDRWGADSDAIYKALQQIDRGVASRAYFATICLKQVHDNVDAGICCALVAQADDGHIVGIMTYFVTPGVGAAIELLAIEPSNLAGTPGRCQLRGIGTAMVAALSRQALAANAFNVNLHPLDSQARQFWKGRGFSECDVGLCVNGRPQVDALINGCDTEPDCPDRGQCVVCGEVRQPLRPGKSMMPDGTRLVDESSVIGPVTKVYMQHSGYVGYVRQTADGTWDAIPQGRYPVRLLASRDDAVQAVLMAMLQ
jgi:hypothetical protein